MTITRVGEFGAGTDVGIASGLTVTFPTGISFGDAIGAVGICSNAVTITAPTGWTVKSGWPKDGGSARFYAWTKDAVTASDSGASALFTSTGNKLIIEGFVLHSGNGFPADWTDDLDFLAHAVTGTSYTTSSSTSTVAGDWGVACFGARGTGPFSDWVAASGLTERQDLTRSGSGAVTLHLCDSAGSIGGASTVWGPFTESNLSTANGGGLTWLVKENATGGGGGGGGGGGLLYPKMGVWYARTGVSWPAAMTTAESTYGPFQGHRSIYYPAGSLPIGTEVENAFRAGKDIHIFWKPWDSAGGSWADTDAGGYDTEIDAVAADVIALCSGTGRKLWLGLHHEPENDTTGASGNFSYSAYRGMWQQVRTRFDSAGASQYVTWIISFMNSHTNPGNNPTGPGQNMLDLWGNDGVMDSLVDIVAMQDYIGKNGAPSLLATRWIEDLEFLVTNSTANRNWSYLDKPQAFTEWGADLGGATTDRGTNLHRAQTIDAIRGILPDLASRNVVSITYFDAITSSSASNGIDAPPAVDGVAFQALKDASEAGQETPPVTVAGVALARDGATGTSTSVPFTLPTGWAQGDYALVFLESNNLPTVSTVPTGWTLRDGPTDTASANGRAWVYWKILQAGEPNPTWTISLSERPSGVMVLLRGVDATNPVHAAQPLAATATGTSHQVAAVSTTATQAFILTAWLARWADASGNGGVNYGTPPGTHTSDGSVSVNSGASAGSGGLVAHLTASPVAAGSHGPYTATFPVTCQGLVTQLALLPAGVQVAPQLVEEATATDTLSVATGATLKTLSDAGTATDAVTVSQVGPKTLSDSGAAADTLQVAVSAPAVGFPTQKIEVAFASQPMAASPVWTDVSAFVLWPITRDYGRPDEFSTVQPGTLRLRLNNSDGRFTMGRTGGPYGDGVRIGRRIRWTETFNGVAYVRFDGHVDTWPTQWVADTTRTAVAEIAATDRLKRLGQIGELRSLLEEETLRDTPAAYYPLSESSEATTVASIATTPCGAGVLEQAGTGGTLEFGAGTGPGTDGLSAAVYERVNRANGKYLVAYPVTVGTSTAVTLECWINTTVTDAPICSLTRPGEGLTLFVGGDGKIVAYYENSSDLQYGNTTGAAYNDGRTHHLVITLSRVGSTVTANLYVDGVFSVAGSGTFTYKSLPTFSRVDIGGSHVQHTVGVYSGTLSHVAAYSTVLSAARILAHYQAGATGLAGERTDQRLGRLADYIALPTADRLFDTGDSTVGAQATSGTQPLEAMRQVEATEQGVLFVNASGKLAFHARSRRYNPTPAVILDAAAGHIRVGVTFGGDDFAVTNDMTVTRAGGGGGRAVNQDSIDEYGLFRSSAEIAADGDDAAAAVAWRRVNTYGTPLTRLPNLTVSLRRLSRQSPAQVAALLGIDIGAMLRLTNLPAQAPAATAEVFVEGWTEQVDRRTGDWTLELNCSPASVDHVWDLGRDGYTELGTTTIVAL